MGTALSAMGINGPFLISQIVNFLILFGLLTVLLWKPAKQRLQERQEMLTQQRKDAEAAAEKLSNIEQESEEILEQARKEANSILADARQQAEEFRKAASQEGEQDAKKAIQKAREQAKEERNRILGEARGQIAALATAAAQKIIDVKLDEERQRALVASFFSGIQDGRVEVLPSELKDIPTDVPALVTSAVPLTDEETDVIRLELSQHLKDGQEIHFKVNPDILGGLVIRVGDRVLDDSVVGKLEKLQASLG